MVKKSEVSPMPLILDPDMLLTCDVATDVDQTGNLFVNYEGGNPLEFSDVRHGQYTTMVLLHKMMKTVREVPVQPENDDSNNVRAESDHIPDIQNFIQNQLDDYYALHGVTPQEDKAAPGSLMQKPLDACWAQEDNAAPGSLMQNQLDDHWELHCVTAQENNASPESSEQQQENTQRTAGGVMRNQRGKRPSPYMYTLNKKSQYSSDQ